MSTTKVLAEITQAFQDEPHPGELDIVYDNSDYQLEYRQIRDSFALYTWQTMPDDLLFYERSAPSFLSTAGLRYYLPAFMQFAVRDYSASDTLPDSLVYDMTLPAELDVTDQLLLRQRFAPAPGQPAGYPGNVRAPSFWVYRFVERYGQFNRAQSRAILHFLEHLRDEHGQDYLHGEPAVAIERYWFQFA